MSNKSDPVSSRHPVSMLFGWMVLAVGIAGSNNTATAQNHASEIEVKSAILKLVADVDVPAREAGVIQSIAVIEGDEVTAGTNRR